MAPNVEEEIEALGDALSYAQSRTAGRADAIAIIRARESLDRLTAALKAGEEVA